MAVNGGRPMDSAAEDEVMSEEAPREPVEFHKWLRFDDRSPGDAGVGPARAVEAEGRCRRCWGPIVGLRQKDGPCTHVECLACGSSADGEAARLEVARMLREAEQNVPLARIGRGSQYGGKARFVLKLLPDMDRDMAWYERGLAASLRLKRRRNYLDRRSFPSGEAGYLFAQAGVLVAGLNALPPEMSALSLADVEYGTPEVQRVEPASGDDGILRVVGTIACRYRKPSNAVVKTRMGRLMMAGSTAAFACELAMKAILMTRNHQAEKTHDLADLYAALPADCRERLEGDSGEIEAVLEESRQTFGRWRYFEQALGGKTFGALVDTDRVWGLGKSARVLLDECVVAGLDYGISVQSDSEVTVEGAEVVDYSAKFNVNVEGNESAVAWDALLSGRRTHG